MPDRLLTPAEAGERLRTSVTTVRRLVAARRLKASFVGLGKIRPNLRIPESSVEAFIEGRR